MRWVHVVVCYAAVQCCSMAVWGQQPTGNDKPNAVEEAIHEELRAVRDALTKAVVDGSVEGQLAHVHDNVVVTWQNNQVVRKSSGLKSFMGEMNTGDDRVFQGYTVPPKADELTILHGADTGIAFGTSTPHYKFMGMEFDLENRWTATLVKQDGNWKIASYHVSGNLADNPILDVAKRSVYWVGGICLLVGLTLGLLLGKLSKRRATSGD